MTTISKLRLLTLSASTLTMIGCQTIPGTMSTPQAGKAKNVILFVGDGMGISTITAARIFDGQSKGMSGEENQLSFEKFPHLALVKTYNLDSQVPDSAGTASAMNTGKKTQVGKINVQPDALFSGCADEDATPPTLFADMAEKAGMATGIVSTARITHATPAAVYGHAMKRGWEADSDINDEGDARGCIDLARQLITYDSGDGIDIALGGGRKNFLPKFDGGERTDGKNLPEDWAAKSVAHIAVDTAGAFRKLDPKDTQSVLGLFNSSHMSFEADRDDAVEPSLSEMTTFAIRNLAARDTGYFLMVEAGRIDHAHHQTNAYRALSETQELARAVAQADALTNDEETLILVTADHSHVFTIAGSPGRGNPILGLVYGINRGTGVLSTKATLAEDGLPYTTLGYHNGPNVRSTIQQTDDMVQSKDYLQQSGILKDKETHAGEDVALFAKGPGADAVRGIIDQAEIFDIMKNATGLKE